MKLVIVQSLVGTSLRFPESVSFISVSFFSAFLSVFASLCLSLPLSLSHYFSASVISFFDNSGEILLTKKSKQWEVFQVLLAQLD